jgi:glutamyl-tRNA synthetase
VSKKVVRTRFAPSPTGSLHIGGLRTALYSYALAKHDGGQFILRIEDTDKKREVKGSKEEIEKHLTDFGLNWDEKYVQSERKSGGIYKNAAEKLVQDGYAFYCNCKAKNAKKEGYSKVLRDSCRDKKLDSGAIKLKVPENENVEFTDYVLGKKISWSTNDVNDATLLKSDGFPTYHLAVVVDDHDMNITHALRGYDWLPSTPIHLLVYKYIGYERPEIGHLTDILDPEGGKLSKRKGSVSVNSFIEEGYLPQALLNFVMLLGWAPKNDREFFTLDEFIKEFTSDGFQRSNPVFNREKLDWMNGEYIRKLKISDISSKFESRNSKFKALDDKSKLKIATLVQDRIKKLSDFETLAGFFFEEKTMDKKLFGENAKMHIKVAHDALSSITDWNLDNINKALADEVEKNDFKTGKFFMDLRIAITGSKFTPPINESIEILGKVETLKRLKKNF